MKIVEFEFAINDFCILLFKEIEKISSLPLISKIFG
jgi:hypothetical protein